jgi:D-alanyl-D-alanine carboxypeptidase
MVRVMCIDSREELVSARKAIGRSPVNSPAFQKLVATKMADVEGPPGKEDRELQNRNVMLWLCRGATGVKTGFTFGAGW